MVHSELRARFAQVPATLPPAGAVAPEQASPLLPGLVENFESNPAGYFPRFSASIGKPEARVVVPGKASAPFQVEDLASGMQVEATLEDVGDTPAEMNAFHSNRELPFDDFRRHLRESARHACVAMDWHLWESWRSASNYSEKPNSSAGLSPSRRLQRAPTVVPN